MDMYRILGVTAVLLVVASAPIARAQAGGAAGEIVSIEGRGEYREARAAGWRSAAVKQSLFPADYVRTGDKSRMGILIFREKATTRIAPNSQFQLKEEGAGKDARTILNLNSGRAWMQSKSAPVGLKVETPSALAAIRGTDWEIAVDGEGRALLSVFSGEVEFYNDHGRVLVAANEQASAEIGKAPVKLALRTSRARMQWVSSVSVDPKRYPDLPGKAATLLLEADGQVFAGDFAAARSTLERGAREFPADDRFPAALSRLALAEGEATRAAALAREVLARKPASVEALLALGDAERLDGRAPEAAEAYGRAIEAAASDARGFEGLGIVESERENVRRARSLLEKALALDGARAGTHAELGTLESFAGEFRRSREELERAIALQPDHYVAWTGLGVLELRTGNPEKALEALLRASLMEPRYARAHLYAAAAYYELERADAALDSLRRAAEADPKDPLPHLLAAIIHVDNVRPGEAAQSAREALARLPFLKSLNQVADNQKGVANVGTSLAALGLEAWARASAQDSYLPFWGGSHLFLADRYPGEFNRRSELMQGFTTDPIVFGASNRFQSLFAAPGHHATAALRGATSDDIRVAEPVLTLNGHSVDPFPVSYFVEGILTRIDPRNAAFEADARTFTAAFGARPTHEVSTFVYMNRLDVDADLGAPGITGDFLRVSGTVDRFDAGLRYAPAADSSLWLKVGASREDSTVDQRTTLVLPDFSLVRDTDFGTRPRAQDGGIRQTLVLSPALEFTWGAEASRREEDKQLVRDASLRFESVPVASESLDEGGIDRMASAFAAVRWKTGETLLDAGLAVRRYTKDRDIVAVLPTGVVPVEEHYKESGADPALGIVTRLGSSTARAACRQWLRPVALDTLMPVAVAGIPLDDQLVLAGGELRQCTARWEWTASESVFATAAAGESRVANLASPLDGPQNARSDVTNLDRLRNRILTPPLKPDQLEDTPVYAEGRVRRGSVAAEAILTRSLGARLHYTYSDSLNTGAYFPGNRIPYIARHHVNVGAVWTPGWRLSVTALASYRSERFTDEANAILLPAGWDAQVTAFWETPDKRWAVEAYGANLFKKEASDVFGAVLSYRF
jgi:tetratricopeptide (TPR) repeat protein